MHIFRYKEASNTIREAMKTPGLSVIITTRPCALHFRIKEPVFQVDPKICIGCRTCIKTNCPPLGMKQYEGIDKLKSSIDPTMCVGCSICAQVCPVDAISRTARDQSESGGEEATTAKEQQPAEKHQRSGKGDVS